MSPSQKATVTSTSKKGYDVSFPQCGQELPTDGSFMVVGVNGDHPNTPNPCFKDEMQLAKKLPGIGKIPGAMIYATAANPSEDIAQVSSWPAAGKNTYGACAHNDTAACSYEYGAARAQADLKTIDEKNLKGQRIFIDVEPEYSWAGLDTHAKQPALEQRENRAALEGMVNTFEQQGMKVGVYSNAATWEQVVGEPNATTPLDKLTVWMMGNTCNSSFTGGDVLMTQQAQAAGGIDTNTPC
jgi:hypothetical protein